jgi:hypothetical protein
MTVSRHKGTFYFDFMVSFFPILKSQKFFLYLLFSSQKKKPSAEAEDFF